MNSVYKFIKENHMLAVVEVACHRKSFTLNLSRFEITDIPEILTTCNSLLKLYLNHNEISRIPESIVALDRLSSLTLDYNKLSEFPQVVCQLTTLRFLNLSCNNIRVLPSEIENLKHLESLWLNNTGLEYIPEQIGGCEELEVFGARGNCIQRLPESLGLLSKLTWLTLEENKITELPQAFVALTNLIHLNLRRNRLSSFPDVVNDIKKIRYCFLEDNCIETITPRQIELSTFMKVLDITNNPAVSSEELVSIFPNFKHVVHNKLDGELLDHSENEDETDWENSVVTSDLNSTDESGDEHEIEQDISLLIPELSRYITTFS